MILEICADSIESALNAEKGGADRIELCAALSEGGLTPGKGFTEQIMASVGIPVHVMLRPRNADFLYSDQEFRIMLRDLDFIRDTGAAGVVFGMLESSGRIDTVRCRELIDRSRPMSVTFHRAFDMARDPFEALDDLVTLGVNRLLTSGKKATAWEGRSLIGELVKRSENRIVIMAGSGVNEGNIQSLIRETGVTECHASAGTGIESPMQYRNTDLSMGSGSRDEYRRMVTDPESVKKLRMLMQT